MEPDDQPPTTPKGEEPLREASQPSTQEPDPSSPQSPHAGPQENAVPTSPQALLQPESQVQSHAQVQTPTKVPPTPHPSSPPPVPTSTKPRTSTLTSGQRPPLPPIPQQQLPSQPYQPSLLHRPFSDPSRLAPEDAYFIPQSPPRIRTENHPNKVAAAKASGVLLAPNGVPIGPPPVIPGLKPTLSLGNQRRRREKDRGRSASSRRRKGVWKKLLWVKQTYPDNYTDPNSFLDHLQRNPRLRPYDFWPLVADSTVIVQHVCSVAIFVCCFVAIFQERLSPISVVGWGSLGTVLGWGFMDNWVSKEEEEAAIAAYGDELPPEDGSSASSELTTASSFNMVASAANGSLKEKDLAAKGLGLTLSTSNLTAPSHKYMNGGHSHSASATSLISATSAPSPVTPPASLLSHRPSYQFAGQPFILNSTLSPRTQARLGTAKSAILIYCALLGLSPILKSLTKSTTSDSIWAMSCWLMGINLFFFDYGGDYAIATGRSGGEVNANAKFPATLSTNAALMASTVLASRLRTSTHVFSLTLFSIEVFGLFPVFRRHLRRISWRGHLTLTIILVIAAGGGVGVILAGKAGGWGSAVVGALVGGLLNAAVMGGCSWWLISLQKYKNVVIGPWDPARPVLKGRGAWD